MSKQAASAARYSSPDAILDIRDVGKRFYKKKDLAARLVGRLSGGLDHDRSVQAVDRVSFSMARGEVVGLVGESGCGKSTLGRMVAGLLEPTQGTIFYKGADIRPAKGGGNDSRLLPIQMIFQDPFASLNPRKRIREIIGEAPMVHGLVKKSELDAYVDRVMIQCGLDPSYKTRYPHQFSGGQRQRVGIARALAVNPDFIICDEAVAALDVSIQAQILNLFIRLREDLNLTYLFISHDMGVVEHISDRIVIMYLGRVVELGRTEDIFETPNHPYTRVLLREVPRLENRRQSFKPVQGEIPSPLDPPPGCHFHPRCSHAFERCRIEAPRLIEIGPGRLSACHLNEKN